MTLFAKLQIFKMKLNLTSNSKNWNEESTLTENSIFETCKIQYTMEEVHESVDQSGAKEVFLLVSSLFKSGKS